MRALENRPSLCKFEACASGMGIRMAIPYPPAVYKIRLAQLEADQSVIARCNVDRPPPIQCCTRTMTARLRAFEEDVGFE
jgi:hypothetical protein